MLRLAIEESMKSGKAEEEKRKQPDHSSFN
jgi:hypothetical protein